MQKFELNVCYDTLSEEKVVHSPHQMWKSKSGNKRATWFGDQMAHEGPCLNLKAISDV